MKHKCIYLSAIFASIFACLSAAGATGPMHIAVTATEDRFRPPTISQPAQKSATNAPEGDWAQKRQPASGAKGQTPSSGAELLDQLFKAYDADTSEKQFAVMRYILELYEQGGEPFYDLHTGRMTRVFPAGLKKAVAEKEAKTRRKLTSEEEQEFKQVYIVLFAREHSPQYMRRYREAQRIILAHPKFSQLASSKLFTADTQEKRIVLANSIAREYCLGGLMQPVLGKGFERSLPENVKSAGGFVDYLAERFSPEYVETLRQVEKYFDEHPEALRTFLEAYAPTRKTIRRTPKE